MTNTTGPEISTLHIFLPLFFSAPGATIFICITLLILIGVFLAFRKKFFGIAMSYKDMSMKFPTNDDAGPQKSVDVPTQASAPKAVENEKPSEQENAEEAKQTSTENQQDAVTQLVTKLREGNRSALDQLLEKEEAEEDPQAAFQLARYYFDVRSFSDALDHSRKAFGFYRTDNEKVSVALLQAEILEADEGKEAAETHLASLADGITDPAASSRLFGHLAEIQIAEGKKFKAAENFEKALQRNPADRQVRFRAAWNYSTIQGMQLAALHHYETLIAYHSGHGSGHNNLSLLFGQLGLTIHQVEQLKLGTEAGNDTAANNLAIKYLRNGFSEEAREIIARFSSGEESKTMEASKELNAAKETEATKLKSLRIDANRFVKQINSSAIKLDALSQSEWKESGGKRTFSIKPDDKGVVTGTLVDGDDTYAAKLWQYNNLAYGVAKSQGTWSITDKGNHRFIVTGDDRTILLYLVDGSSAPKSYSLVRAAIP